MSHSSSIQQIDSPIQTGIKSVGVGKKGSRSLNAELAQTIYNQLKSGGCHPAAIGAFYAGLVVKGFQPEEDILKQYFPPGTVENPEQLAKQLAADAPQPIIGICIKLLAQKELSLQEAYELGKFLMSSEPGDGARGLAASTLRVRYETADEYEGLRLAVAETLTPAFRQAVPAGNPIIQLAEPFDGVDHNYMITPCLAFRLQKHGYRVVSMVGRNSGPKFCFNLYDICQKMAFPFLKENTQINPVPAVGYAIDQKDLSPALDHWVDLRHTIIKRPFLATLEKFINPLNADILITSAFHGVYGEKMIEIAQRAQFPAAIVVRNGVEGTIAFPLTRPVKLLCTVRQPSGQYLKQEWTSDISELLPGTNWTSETKLDHPSLDENCQLIHTFLKTEKSGNLEFDARINATYVGLLRALHWIQSQRRTV